MHEVQTMQPPTNPMEMQTRSTPGAATTTLLDLPAELLLSILSQLDELALARTAQTCRRLAAQSYDEKLWQQLLSASLGGVCVATAAPCTTFRALFLAHRPHAFVARQRVWFGDAAPGGKLVLARWDPMRGAIEARTVVAAARASDAVSLWEHNRSVMIHDFSPAVRLAPGQPVLRLDASKSGRASGGTEHDVVGDDDGTVGVATAVPGNSSSSNGSNYCSGGASTSTCIDYGKEVLMDVSADTDGLHSAFVLARALPAAAITESTRVWPPLRFPARSRTRNDSRDRFASAGHRPQRWQEVSQDAFRVRRWVEYTGRRGASTREEATPQQLQQQQQQRQYPSLPGMPAFLSRLRVVHGVVAAAAAAGGIGTDLRVPESVTTFATLPPSCYIPTRAKPWQGIWCGDYSGHGCEFLLLTQPDRGSERPLPEDMDDLLTAMGEMSGTQHGDSERQGSADSSETSFVSAEEAELQQQQQESTNAAPPALENSTARVGGFWEDSDDYALLPPPPPTGSTTARRIQPSTANAAGAAAKDAIDVPSGRLEAIKLTGDPNVPRGEYTFIAPELGPAGLLRVADEHIFRGARVVRSAGHIAGRGFMQDRYTPSQLIIISHDRLAQYWEEFGHISYYQRVDLDALTASD